MTEAYAVRRTVPPSAEIDELLAVGVGENPRESLSELARLGARLIIQRGCGGRVRRLAGLGLLGCAARIRASAAARACDADDGEANIPASAMAPSARSASCAF